MCSIVGLPAGLFFSSGSATDPPPVVALRERSCFDAPPLIPPCVYDAGGGGGAEAVRLLRGIKRSRVVAPIPDFFSAGADPSASDLPAPAPAPACDAPRTPVATLEAPLSYDGDEDEHEVESSVTMAAKSKRRKTEEDPSWAYDGSIDATLRKMERDPAETSSEDYIWTTQEGQVTAADRAELVARMYDICYDFPPGALHRAVSYVDRFLSANKVIGGHRLRLLGGAAVFVAAKYEEWCVLDADDVAREVGGGCARRDVLGAERELVVALGYRLGGPTASTFVDHFTRREGDESAVRSLAYHLTELALLDYGCVPFLPSAVAAAAILLARSVVLSLDQQWSEELTRMTGYRVQDLTGVVDAMYEMHECEWPEVALIMDNGAIHYSLPSRSSLIM